MIARGKLCPKPWIEDENAWKEFLGKVEECNLEKEASLEEKVEQIKSYFGFDNNTINYFKYYRYGSALIDKLYDKAKNGEK